MDGRHRGSGAHLAVIAATGGLGHSSGRLSIVAGSKVVARRRPRPVSPVPEQEELQGKQQLPASKKKGKPSFRRRRKGVPSYLREDFPKYSLGKKASVLDKYSLGFFPNRPKPAKKRRRRRSKKQMPKKPESIAMAEKRREKEHIADLYYNNIYNTKSPRRPQVRTSNQRHDVSQLMSVREIACSKPVVKVRGSEARVGEGDIIDAGDQEMSAVPNPEIGKTRSLTAAERRINERIQEISVPAAASAFFKHVDKIQMMQKDAHKSAVLLRRSSGKCALHQNMQAVQGMSEASYAEQMHLRRRALMDKLNEGIARAREKKQQYERDKQLRLHEMIERQRTTAEKREWRRARSASACGWMSALYSCKFASKLDKLAKSLQWRKVLRYKAIVIQRNVRIFLARRERFRLVWAKEIISRFLKKHFLPRRHELKARAACLIGTFLLDNQKNVLQIIRDWRRRVLRCQKVGRSFLMCTQARLNALSRLWTKHERVIANQARVERRRQLELQSKRLKHLSQEMQTSTFQKQMAKNWLRGVRVPDNLGIPTKEGRLFFPVGVHQRHAQDAQQNGVTASVVAAAEGRTDGIHAQQKRYDERLNRNVRHVMDLYLNDEVQNKLEREKHKPLSLNPVPKAQRLVILRRFISETRKKHREESKELLRKHQEALQNQNVVGVREARRMIRATDRASMDSATKKISVRDYRPPMVTMYTSISGEQMFQMVKTAQLAIRRSPSLTRIISDLEYRCNREKSSNVSIDVLKNKSFRSRGNGSLAASTNSVTTHQSF